MPRPKVLRGVPAAARTLARDSFHPRPATFERQKHFLVAERRRQECNRRAYLPDEIETGFDLATQQPIVESAVVVDPRSVERRIESVSVEYGGANRSAQEFADLPLPATSLEHDTCGGLDEKRRADLD